MFESFMHTVVKKLSSNILTVLLVGLTATSSGVAATKLYKEYASEVEPSALEVIDDSFFDVFNSDEKEELAKNSSSGSKNSTSVSNSTTSTNDNSSFDTATNEFPAAVPTTSNTVSDQTTTSSSSSGSQVATCIVTVFGKNYDVQPLRSSHSGGDVFKCGTDMSSTYQKEHGSNVSRISQYLTSAPLGSSNQSSNATQPSSFKSEEEYEDEEYEEENENHYEDKEDEKYEKDEKDEDEEHKDEDHEDEHEDEEDDD